MAMTGVEIDSPYQLSDMAADGIGLLDALSVERAHVVGASMGAMIVQQMVIDYPERVRSLTSIMSTTGDADVGQPHPELLMIAAEQAMAPATTRDAVLDASVKICRAFSSKRYFDAERVRDVTGVTREQH